mmetsp:Transcript_42450/g.77045  ORF Transcript_42450/g.77045 Transcript_42450/m.77045 type:complete len:312 (+) Transcript_42450:106-1041(+)
MLGQSGHLADASQSLSDRSTSQNLNPDLSGLPPMSRRNTRQLTPRSPARSARSGSVSGRQSPDNHGVGTPLARKGTRKPTAMSVASNDGEDMSRKTTSRQQMGRQLTSQQTTGKFLETQKEEPALNHRTVAARLHAQNSKLASFELERFWHSGYYLPQLQSVDYNEKLMQHWKNLLKARDLKQIEMFLHAGCSPNLVINDIMQTPLHVASEAGDEVLCSILLRFAADPSQQDQTRLVTGEAVMRTPLQLAEENGHSHIVHLLSIHMHKLRQLPELSMDFGIDYNPRKRGKPVPLPLRAKEPGFMSRDCPGM